MTITSRTSSAKILPTKPDCCAIRRRSSVSRKSLCLPTTLLHPRKLICDEDQKLAADEGFILARPGSLKLHSTPSSTVTQPERGMTSHAPAFPSTSLAFHLPPRTVSFDTHGDVTGSSLTEHDLSLDFSSRLVIPLRPTPLSAANSLKVVKEISPSSSPTPFLTPKSCVEKRTVPPTLHPYVSPCDEHLSLSSCPHLMLPDL